MVLKSISRPTRAGALATFNLLEQSIRFTLKRSPAGQVRYLQSNLYISILYICITSLLALSMPARIWDYIWLAKASINA